VVTTLRKIDTNAIAVDESRIIVVNGQIEFAEAVVYFEEVSNPLASQVVYENEALPEFGSEYSTNHPDTVLDSIDLSVVGRDSSAAPYKCRASCIYRLKLASNVAQITPIRGSSSMHQFRTFYDGFGQRLTNKNPQDDTITGQTSGIVLSPQLNFTIQAVKTMANPVFEQDRWTGVTNSDTFLGQLKKTLLITSVSFEPVNRDAQFTSKARWLFTYTIERGQQYAAGATGQGTAKRGWVYESDMYRKADGTFDNESTVENGGITVFTWHLDQNFSEIWK